MKTNKKKSIADEKLDLIDRLNRALENMPEKEITVNSAKLKVIIIDMITVLLENPNDPVTLQNAILKAARKLNEIVDYGEFVSDEKKAARVVKNDYPANIRFKVKPETMNKIIK